MENDGTYSKEEGELNWSHIEGGLFFEIHKIPEEEMTASKKEGKITKKIVLDMLRVQYYLKDEAHKHNM